MGLICTSKAALQPLYRLCTDYLWSGEIQQNLDLIVICSSYCTNFHGFLQTLSFGKKWHFTTKARGGRLSCVCLLQRVWFFPCLQPSLTPVMGTLQCRDLPSRSSQQSLSMTSSFLNWLISASNVSSNFETALTSASSSYSGLSVIYIRSFLSTASCSSVLIWPIWVPNSAE